MICFFDAIRGMVRFTFTLTLMQRVSVEMQRCKAERSAEAEEERGEGKRQEKREKSLTRLTLPPFLCYISYCRLTSDYFLIYLLLLGDTINQAAEVYLHRSFMNANR